MADKNELNFALTKKGPLIPEGVNQKSFTSQSLGAGDNCPLKPGQVLKVTGGKIRVRNADAKNFTDKNSVYAEKGDILQVTGPAVAVNEDKNEPASFRIFTANK